MKRIIEIFITLLVVAGGAAGQDVERAVEALGGEVESLGEDDFPELSSLLAAPLPVNAADASALAAAGLFSEYQIASIIDYRSQHGDILSATELGLLDGFNPYFVSRIRHLLSFEKAEGLSQSRLRSNVSNRFWLKDSSTSWGLRAKASLPGRFEAGIAARSAYSDTPKLPPSSYSFYIILQRGRSRYAVGDINLRFAQGLVLWNGLSFTGVSTPLSMIKRASGLSGSSSYSGASHRGLAWEYRKQSFVATSFITFPGLRGWFEGGRFNPALMAGTNLSLLLRHGQLGLTAYAQSNAIHNTTFCLEQAAVSLDGRFCIRGRDIFFEAAFEPRLAAPAVGGAGYLPAAFACTGGAAFPLGRARLGVSARYLSRRYRGGLAAPVRAWSAASDEAGAAIALGLGELAASIDAATKPSSRRQQLKLKISDVIKIGSWSLKPYAQARIRNYGTDKSRCELRLDISRAAGALTFNARADAVKCIESGFLSYLESGFKPRDDKSFWMRGTIFRADNWYDRLFCYERDAPGNFLVPFYYGRGYALSAYASLKWSIPRRGRIGAYLRAAYNGFFPDSQRKKPGSVELRLSITWSGF